MDKIEKSIERAIMIKTTDDVIKNVDNVAKKRPRELNGITYAVKTRLLKHTLYVTINSISENGITRPFEIFMNSKDSRKHIDLTILSKLLSSSFRRELNICYLIDDLMSTNSNNPDSGYFRPPRTELGETKGMHVPSIYYEIGEILKEFLDKHIGVKCDGKRIDNTIIMPTETVNIKMNGDDIVNKFECPECFSKNISMTGGCKTCLDCGWSACS